MKSREEHQLQKSIVQYIGYACPEVLCFSIPNGFYGGDGENKFAHLNNLKAEGLLPGMCDLCLIWPNCGICMVECKSLTGRITQGQKDIHAKLKKNGIPVFIVRRITELYEIIRDLQIPCRDKNSLPVER